MDGLCGCTFRIVTVHDNQAIAQTFAQKAVIARSMDHASGSLIKALTIGREEDDVVTQALST